MKEILSAKNALIKEIKKLHKKTYREEMHRYVIEGFHLVEEAVKSAADIQWILVNHRGRQEWSYWLKQQEQEKLLFVSDEILSSLSELPTAQGMLAVVAIPDEVPTPSLKGRWLLLDHVQDPGNVGTMVRTADATGLSGVILGEGCADVYNTKVLRAMQGSNYHLPVIQLPLEQVITRFKEEGVPVFGTELNEAAVAYQNIEVTEHFALIMGNEGQGISEALLNETDKNLYIPIIGQAESLNVAVAAGILLYHFTITN